MLVLEKLRAICQQIPEYREIVKSHPANPRARDFFDIHIITQTFPLDINNQKIRDMLVAIFGVKKVPLYYLSHVSKYREFHRRGFSSLKDTVRSGTKLEEFDFYFEYVLNMINTIKF